MASVESAACERSQVLRFAVGFDSVLVISLSRFLAYFPLRERAWESFVSESGEKSGGGCRIGPQCAR